MKLIEKFLPQFSIWQVWDDLMYFCAVALSQPCQWVQKREDEYSRRIARYPKELQDLFPQMFAEIVLAFEREGFVDALGEIYMILDFGDNRRGQYFTPYNVSRMMGSMIADDPSDEIEQNGFISVADCCCGSGAMLIAFAQNCVDNKIDYQRNVLFVGQDVDSLVARMCYIGLSLLGCSGYVIVGNSLTQPAVGDVLSPTISDEQEVWYTPMFFGEVWHWRRLFRSTMAIMSKQKCEEVLI
jgi:type I restriction-modification system DNA methylase subunit